MSSNKIIGIDLGTTNSCVAVMEGGTPKVILTSEGRNVIPSIVEMIKGTVGDLAKRQMVLNPKKIAPYTIVEGKDKAAAIEIEGKIYTPQEISAKILMKAKADAEKYLG